MDRGDQEAASGSKLDPGRGWRHYVLHFAPSWFSVVMGTGIVSILLFSFPFNSEWLRILSIIVTCLNLVIFVSFLVITVLRYILFPGIFGLMIRHPVQSLFLGTFPMGMATLISMASNLCVHTHWVQIFSWSMWWVNVVISVGCATTLPFLMMHVHETRELNSVTAVWLLPIVPLIVAAATGATLANNFLNTESLHHLVEPTVFTCYTLWGGGFLLAMITLVLYFHRLLLQRLPPREIIASVFLPLGPLGQSMFGLLQLGKVCKLYVGPHLASRGIWYEQAGDAIHALTIPVVFSIGGYAFIWLVFALASITRRTFPFNNGWWAFTFPIGTYALGTGTLGQVLQSEALKIIASVMSLSVIILYLIVAAGTIRGVISGELIQAPCVLDYLS